MLRVCLLCVVVDAELSVVALMRVPLIIEKSRSAGELGEMTRELENEAQLRTSELECQIRSCCAYP